MPPSTENKWVLVKPRDIRNVNIFIKEGIDESAAENVKSLCEAQLKLDKKLNAFVLKKTDLDEFLEAVDEIAPMKASPSETNEVEDDDDDESSEDDATIQLVLTKNLKHKSSGEIITETNVSDSELEESISLSRRLRHVYAKLSELEKRLAALENLDRQ